MDYEAFLKPESLKWYLEGWNGEYKILSQNFRHYPPATEAIAFFKRQVMIRLKSFENPFLLLFYKRFIEELEDSAEVIKKYYLKPENYGRAVRELFRIGKVLEIKEENIHTGCSVFQWDIAYLSRLMIYFVRLNKENLVENPRQEINKMLRFAEMSDDNEFVRSKYKAIRKLFNMLWFIPKFRKAVKIVAKEIRLKEFEMSEQDIGYAYK